MDIDPQDCRIESFRQGPPGQSKLSMRITHEPTGLSVSGEGDIQHQLRDQLLEELKQKRIQKRRESLHELTKLEQELGLQ